MAGRTAAKAERSLCALALLCDALAAHFKAMAGCEIDANAAADALALLGNLARAGCAPAAAESAHE